MLRVKVKVAVPVPLEMYQHLHEKPPRLWAADTFHFEPSYEVPLLDIRLPFPLELQWHRPVPLISARKPFGVIHRGR